MKQNSPSLEIKLLKQALDNNLNITICEQHIKQQMRSDIEFNYNLFNGYNVIFPVKLQTTFDDWLQELTQSLQISKKYKKQSANKIQQHTNNNYYSMGGIITINTMERQFNSYTLVCTLVCTNKTNENYNLILQNVDQYTQPVINSKYLLIFKVQQELDVNDNKQTKKNECFNLNKNINQQLDQLNDTPYLCVYISLSDTAIFIPCLVIQSE